MASCLESDESIGLRLGVQIFHQLIEKVGHDMVFYEQFLLHHFVPFCIITPTQSTFRLNDAQFNLIINEMANCLHLLAKKQVRINLVFSII